MPRLILLYLLCPSLFAMTVLPEKISSALLEAPLVAEIEVLDVHSFRDPGQHSIVTESWNRILRVIKIRDDGGYFPGEGETVSLSGPGGEIEGLGMYLTGYPRPHRGRRYRAHLKRKGENQFEVAGLEFGFEPLEKTRAYSRNRTDGSNGEGEGSFLYWDESYFPVPYYISLSTFQGFIGAAEAIDASFKTWRDPDNITLEIQPMGCTEEYRNQNDGINNMILVNANWTFDSAAIAITRNFYIAGTSPKAGLILDSDILLNGVDHAFTTTNEDGKHDIQNIVTHEIGHFFGLGHEINPIDTEATMYAQASPNEIIKRTLNTTDTAGLAEAYEGVSLKFNQFSGTPSCDLRATGSVSCMAVHYEDGNSQGKWTLFFLLITTLTTILVGRKLIWH